MKSAVIEKSKGVWGQIQPTKLYVFGERKRKSYSCLRRLETYFSLAGCELGWPGMRREEMDNNHKQTGFLCT
jgi:hypothetical protein